MAELKGILERRCGEGGLLSFSNSKSSKLWGMKPAAALSPLPLPGAFIFKLFMPVCEGLQLKTYRGGLFFLSSLLSLLFCLISRSGFVFALAIILHLRLSLNESFL